MKIITWCILSCRRTPWSMEIINAHQLRVASQEAAWFKWPWASSAPFQSTTLKKYICLPSNLKLGRELFSIPASSQLVRVVCSDCFPGETWTMPLGEIMKYSFPFSYHRQQVASSHKSRARILASHDTTGFNHLKSTCVPRKPIFLIHENTISRLTWNIKCYQCLSFSSTTTKS